MMRTLLAACVLGVLAFQAGCTKPAADNKVTKDGTAGENKHDGWWCVEHGVPEGECALCSTKVAADFKKKGDWCKEHDRPESQCFICHPELEQKFAARYEAKFGSKPPPREE
jgi:hypothetical protein